MVPCFDVGCENRNVVAEDKSCASSELSFVARNEYDWLWIAMNPVYMLYKS